MTIAGPVAGPGPVEIPDQRAETVTAFRHPDGARTIVLSSGPIRLHQGADWQPIDLTLRRDPDGGIRPVSHPDTLWLSGGGRPADAAAVRGPDGSNIALPWNAPLPAPKLTGNRAVYANARPGADLVIEATRTGYVASLESAGGGSPGGGPAGLPSATKPAPGSPAGTSPKPGATPKPAPATKPEPAATTPNPAAAEQPNPAAAAPDPGTAIQPNPGAAALPNPGTTAPAPAAAQAGQPSPAAAQPDPAATQPDPAAASQAAASDPAAAGSAAQTSTPASAVAEPAPPSVLPPAPIAETPTTSPAAPAPAASPAGATDPASAAQPAVTPLTLRVTPGNAAPGGPTAIAAPNTPAAADPGTATNPGTGTATSVSADGQPAAPRELMAGPPGSITARSVLSRVVANTAGAGRATLPFGTTVQNTVLSSDLSGDPDLKIGSYDGHSVARAYLSWDLSRLRGQHVIAATLRLYSDWSSSCQPSGWEVWSSPAVGPATRWANQPAAERSWASSTATLGHDAHCQPGWTSVNLSDLVKSWVASGATSGTVQLRATNESDPASWKRFSSGAGEHVPALGITLAP